jgi:hypothetical protein
VSGDEPSHELVAVCKKIIFGRLKIVNKARKMNSCARKETDGVSFSRDRDVG